MFKKIAVGLVFMLFAGILVVGAINRTSAKTEQVAEAKAAEGHEAAQAVQFAEHVAPASAADAATPAEAANVTTAKTQPGPSAGPTTGGKGQGQQGSGYGRGPAQQPAQNNAGQANTAELPDYITIEGPVIQAPAPGVDMIVGAGDGDYTIGARPDYLTEQGFVLAIDEPVRVTGFWEDGEFKAVEIVRLSSGETLVVRDEWGRPMWSGAVANGRGSGRGQGQGSSRPDWAGQGQGQQTAGNNS